MDHLISIRVRAVAPDPFNGARGHDYIALRGLQPKIGRIDRPADIDNCQCQKCVQERLLPIVKSMITGSQEKKLMKAPAAAPQNFVFASGMADPFAPGTSDRRFYVVRASRR